MTTLRMRIEEPEDLASVQSWASEHDDATYEVLTTDEDEGLAIEPVTAVLIGAGILALAGFVRNWIISQQGGTVVDMRPDATDQIYRDKDVNYGWLLVITADGKVEVNVKDAPKDSSERLIEQVISGALKGVKEVAEKAKELLGGDKVKPETA